MNRSVSGTPKYARFISLLLAAAAADASFAQEIIVTDRPDFTESAFSVAPGRVQIEGGVTFSDEGSVDALSWPEVLIRVGISDAVEFRLTAPDYVDIEDVEGFSDMAFGAKLELPKVLDGWDLAIIGGLELPTGDDEFSGGSVGAEFILIGGTSVGERSSFGTQVAVATVGDGEENSLQMGATAVFGTSFSDAVGGFLELAATVPEEGDPELIGHTGLVYLVRENAQFDIHFGLGLTEVSPDALVGAGFSVRF
jgi:hypothetical protein